MDEHLNREQRIMSAHLTPREMLVLSKQRWEDVRQMHAQGVSNSEIAGRLEVDRKTVRKALREPWRAYSRAQPSKPCSTPAASLATGSVFTTSGVRTRR